MNGESESVRRATRRSVKGAATRRALMEAAFRVFAERGFLRTRISDIAREAGKSTGVLYIYFRDKEAILDAWLDEVDATVPWYHADTSLLYDKAHGFVLDSYWTLYGRYGPVIDALEAASLASDHFDERLAALHRHGNNALSRMIRRAQGEGRCPGIDPELTAVAIASLIGRSTAYWFRNRATLEARGVDPVAARANIDTLFTRMLGETDRVITASASRRHGDRV